MVRISILLVLIFLSKLVVVVGQDIIHGRIVDKKDNAPLPWVTVSIKGKPIGTATNSNGEFALKRVGDGDSLHISMIGYENVDTVLSVQTERHSILLKEKITLLPQMDVSPLKAENILAEVYKKIKNNYPVTSTTFTAIYREQVVQESEYAFLGNAQFFITVPSYWYDETIKNKDKKKFEVMVGDVMVTENKIDKRLNFKVPPSETLWLMYPNFGMVQTPEYFDFKILRQFYWNKSNYVEIRFKTKAKYWKDLPAEGNILIDMDDNVVVSISWDTERKDEKSTGFNKESKLFTATFKTKKYTQKAFFEKKPDGRWGLKYAQLYWDLIVSSDKAKINQKYTLISDLLVTTDKTSETFVGESLETNKDFFNKKSVNPTDWSEFNVIVPDFSIKNE
jgi:hypothetical protein